MERGHSFTSLAPQGIAITGGSSYGRGGAASLAWLVRAWPDLCVPTMEEGGAVYMASHPSVWTA